MMRIREFTVNRFGTLAGQRVPRLGEGITVILGDNEAGKSTCLNFIRAMLFGYSRPHKNLEFLTDKNGSGSMVLDTDEYGPLRLFREAGRHGGTPVLTDPGGAPRPDADLSRILRGCSVDLYDRVFAFSLGELMHVSSLSDGRIRHALHGAAFGTGLTSPAQVLKTLDADMRELFLPGGSKPKINELLRALDEVSAVIRERGDEVARYAELMERLEAAERDLAESGAARAALEEERRVLERTASLRRRWEEWREAGDILKALPEVAGTFTPDGRERMDRLTERIGERTRALSAARLALEGAEKERASLAFDSALDAAASAVFALSERKESVRNAAARIEALRAESGAHSRSAASVCADLGPEWDAEKLSGADFSLAVFERCERLGKTLAATEGALAHAAAAAEGLAREKAAAGAALEETLAEIRKLAEEPGGHSAEDLPAEGGGSPEEIFERRAGRLGDALAKAEDAAENTGALALAVRDAEAAYNEAVAAVDAGWSREDFEKVSLRPAERETLLVLARSVEEREARLLEAERERNAAARLREDSFFRVGEGEASLARRVAALGLPGKNSREVRAALDARRAVLRRAQAERRRFEEARAAYESVNEQLGDITNLVRVARPKSAFPWSLAVLFFAALCLACGAGLYFFGVDGAGDLKEYGLTALMAGCAFLLAWLALFAKGGDVSAEALEKSRAAIEDRLVKKRREAETAGTEARDSLVSLAREDPEMFPGGSVTAEALAEADVLLANLREGFAAVEREGEALERDKAALTAAARREESAEGVLEAAREALALAREEWAGALSTHGLPSSVPAKGARSLMERLDAASARRSAFSGRVADEENARERIGACLREARAVPGLADMLASLPEPGSPFAPVPGPWLSLVREYLAAWKRAERERVRLRDIAGLRAARLAETEEKYAGAESARRAAAEAHGRAAADWAGWLEERNLAPALSPETARRAQEGAARAKAALAEALRLDAQAGVLCRERDAFFDDFSTLAHLLPGSVFPGGLAVEEALALLDALAEKARLNREKGAVAAAREREIPSLRAAVTLAEEDLATSRDEAAEILSLAGCETPELFRAAHGRWMEREAALAAARAVRAALERQAGDAGLALEDVEASFAAFDGAALTAKIAELDARLGTALTTEHVLAEEKGKLDAARAGLLHEKSLAELLARREALSGEIESLSREWMRLATAREMLLTAKGRFEVERRDGVVRYAGDMFNAITEGAYSGITVALDGEGVLAVAGDGGVKEPQSELSRGTREQLYLALRLGYIINHGKEAEKLPVVMDDILVNFDAKRAENTAKVLASFAAEHQILFFTCHERTAEMLCRASKDAVRYTMEQGVFAAG